MKLSIVVTAYNLEKYINKSLDSLIRQTSKQFELIVVDDGSTDGTLYRIKEMTLGVSDIEVMVISKDHGGVSAARNRGLKAASGEYTLFLDGDDYVADNLVECICDALSRQTGDVICWGFQTVDENGTVLTDYFDTYKQIEREVSGVAALKKILVDRSMWICTGSAAYRKNFLNEYQLNYTEGCTNGEDQEFNIKVLSKAGGIIFLNQTLLFYVQRRGSVTKSRCIHKFDATSAMQRAIGYLNIADNQELKRIADLIGTQHLVENYFNSLDSCLKDLDVRPLLKAINEIYPDLAQEIKNNMRHYPGSGQKLDKYQIKCRLFLISPNLYASFVFLIRRAFCLRKGWASK